MFSTILPVIAPVIIGSLLGAAWVRAGQGFEHDFVRRLVMWIGAPCLIVGTLGEVRISVDTFNTVLQATLLMLAIAAALAAMLCRLLSLPLSVYGVPLVFGNSGNMGLPLCLFAFGQQGLALGLGIFLVISLVHFSCGVAAVSGRLSGGQLLRTPIVYAGALGALLIYMDWQLPLAVRNTLSLLGGMAIPLMLLTLGASLGGLKLRDGLPAVGMGVARLVIGIAAGLLTVWLMDLQGVMRGVLLLQAATPAAVFNYLLALQFDRQPQRVAGLVMASTLISFVTIPLLLLALGI